MDITFSCENCGQELVVDESGAGTIVDCPRCGQNVWIPAASNPVGTASRKSPATSRASSWKPTTKTVIVLVWTIVFLVGPWVLNSIVAPYLRERAEKADQAKLVQQQAEQAKHEEEARREQQRAKEQLEAEQTAKGPIKFQGTPEERDRQLKEEEEARLKTFVGSIRYLDEKYGFRDVKFGQSPSALENLELVERHPSEPIAVYRRTTDDMTLYGHSLKSLKYYFWDDKLWQVVIELDDQVAPLGSNPSACQEYLDVRQTLIDLYGTPTDKLCTNDSNAFALIASTSGTTWSGSKGIANFTVYVSGVMDSEKSVESGHPVNSAWNIEAITVVSSRTTNDEIREFERKLREEEATKPPAGM
jgi:hypothetical protein